MKVNLYVDGQQTDLQVSAGRPIDIYELILKKEVIAILFVVLLGIAALVQKKYGEYFRSTPLIHMPSTEIHPMQRPVETIESQLSELETLYLESFILTEENPMTEEVLTSKELQLGRHFYDFRSIPATFFSGTKRHLKRRVSKKELEKKLLASLPELFHEQVRYLIKPILLISQKHNIDPFWVTSIMWTESHFKWKARSGVGASGLMQIMPATQKFLLKFARRNKVKLEALKGWDYLAQFNPNMNTWKNYKTFKSKVLNIELGVFYLKRLLRIFKYNFKFATVAYNMGPGWTLKRLRRKQPVGEKNEYLTKVRRAYNFIAKRLPKA